MAEAVAVAVRVAVPVSVAALTKDATIRRRISLTRACI